jgi:lysyl-tRNA synthetase class II
MDVNGMMDFCEEMIRSTALAATGNARSLFGEQEIDFSLPFERLTM